MNFCQNENKYEMKHYPIVEIEMVLRQPDLIFSAWLKYPKSG
jgi:hypothetical protein